MQFVRETFCRPEKQEGREAYIDLAKGICILLVVAYHYFARDYPVFRQIRMPLYFVLSGLFFHDYGSLLRHVVKKIDRNIVPMLFFVAIGAASFIVKCMYSRSVVSDLVEGGTFLTFMKVANPVLWFLLALFWVNIIFYVIKRTVRKEPWIFLAVVSLGMTGCIIPDHFGRWLYGVAALRALPFFYMGYALQRTYLLGGRRRPRYAVALAILLLALCTVIALLLGDPYIRYFEGYFEGSPLLYYIAGAAGVMGLLMLCREVQWLPFVSYCGRFSIIILGVHMPLFRLIRFAVTDEQYHTVLWIKLLVMSTYLLALWLSIPLLRRIAPRLCAQKELFSRNKKLQHQCTTNTEEPID